MSETLSPVSIPIANMYLSGFGSRRITSSAWSRLMSCTRFIRSLLFSAFQGIGERENREAVFLGKIMRFGGFFERAGEGHRR